MVARKGVSMQAQSIQFGELLSVHTRRRQMPRRASFGLTLVWDSSLASVCSCRSRRLSNSLSELNYLVCPCQCDLACYVMCARDCTQLAAASDKACRMGQNGDRKPHAHSRAERVGMSQL